MSLVTGARDEITTRLVRALVVRRCGDRWAVGRASIATRHTATRPRATHPTATRVVARIVRALCSGTTTATRAPELSVARGRPRRIGEWRIGGGGANVRLR
eukprot:5544160-Pyramimonas_sp.AAC.2